MPASPRQFTSRRPRAGSIGHFLCNHATTPPFVDLDRLSWPDIKQDACLRAVIALKRAGKPIGPDPVAAFDAEPRLVWTAYRRALADALREQAGFTLDRDGRRIRRLVSLDHGFDDIVDPAHEEALEFIVRRVVAATRLLLVLQRRSNVFSPKRMLRLLRTLRRIQRIKDSGHTVVPPHLRRAVSRARSKSGLPLDLNLL